METQVQTLENGYQLSGESVLYYQDNPVEFAKDQLGYTPYTEQAELLIRVVKDRKWTAWRSGHGPGKSTGLGMLVLTWLYMFPESRVVCTAPKIAQLFDVLWAEINKILIRSKIAHDFIWTKTKIYIRDRESTCIALARTSRTPEAMAGQHAKNMLYIFDEASGVDMAVFEAAEGSQTTRGAVMVLAGNPTQSQGYFFDAFHKDRSRWHNIHTSVENHPNVVPEYAKRMARKWGLESDVYRVRVLGDFPVGDPNTFIVHSRVEAAINREVVPEGPIKIGLDVARFGDDRTIAIARRGLHVFEHHVNLARSTVPEVIGATTHFLKEIRAKTGYTGQSDINVDDGGVGGGVTDGLRLIGPKQGFEVIACHFGGAGNDQYDDEATIMWAELRDLIDEIELPDIEDMVGEISLRRYGITPNGKIKIEPKKIFKERVKLSPDYADAVVLAFARGNALSVEGGFGYQLSTTDWG